MSSSPKPKNAADAVAYPEGAEEVRAKNLRKGDTVFIEGQSLEVRSIQMKHNQHGDMLAFFTNDKHQEYYPDELVPGVVRAENRKNGSLGTTPSQDVALEPSFGLVGPPKPVGSKAVVTLQEARADLKALGYILKTKAGSGFSSGTVIHKETGEKVSGFNVMEPAMLSRHKAFFDYQAGHTIKDGNWRVIF